MLHNTVMRKLKCLKTDKVVIAVYGRLLIASVLSISGFSISNGFNSNELKLLGNSLHLQYNTSIIYRCK